MDIGQVKFNEQGLVPAIAQDRSTLRVLMLAWMNRESLELTISTGVAHYWSRSRASLWKKGETSGNVQKVRSVHYDCDADTVLLVVDPAGPACHTGEVSCFYRNIEGADAAPAMAPAGESVLPELFEVLEARKNAEPGSSYVASLYSKGRAKILEKVAEESAELIEAAEEKGRDQVVYELADLWFHTMVLLANEGISIGEVTAEFDRRFGTSGITEKASRKGRGEKE